MVIRVAQWTAGIVGACAARAVMDHPDTELVALYTRPGEKAGKDVGELIGRAATGMKAVDSIEAVLAAKPDLVLYMPLVWDVEAMARLLEAGVNVISTANFITGRSYGDGVKARLHAAGLKGNASLYGTGINPGHANALGLMATAVCTEVRRVSVLESVDASGYASKDTWIALGYGGEPNVPGLAEKAKERSLVFVDAVEMMAEALDAPLDEIKFKAEFGTATEDVDLGWWQIAKGKVCGLKMNYIGVSRGRELIDLGLMWRLGKKMTPNWEPEAGYVIKVEGDPNVDCRFHVSGADASSSGLITAMPAVNAIAAVVAARPGLVTVADLPLTVAHGRA